VSTDARAAAVDPTPDFLDDEREPDPQHAESSLVPDVNGRLRHPRNELPCYSRHCSQCLSLRFCQALQLHPLRVRDRTHILNVHVEVVPGHGAPVLILSE
jgi:hypothetical protein